jgi:hypothetical protein
VTRPEEITRMVREANAALGVPRALLRGRRRAARHHRERREPRLDRGQRHECAQVIYADGGASLMNPEVPPELQLPHRAPAQRAAASESREREMA